MRASSLARRLFLTAVAVTVIVLAVAGIALSSLYRTAVERSFDRQLNIYLKAIVVDVATAPTRNHSGSRDRRAIVRDPKSGWYWQIERLFGQQTETKRSPSLPEPGLPSLDEQRIPIRR